MRSRNWSLLLRHQAPPALVCFPGAAVRLATVSIAENSYHHAMPPIRVLVIDDREAHASGLAELLQISGFEASYVTTGLGGLQIASSAPLEAILLDIQLPDVNGYEVCRRLRSDALTADIAVIFHSAAEPAVNGHEGDAFLTYPVETSHISNVIRGCVARRSSLRTLPSSSGRQA